MTPDHVSFRVNCPPMGFPVEVRVWADGMALCEVGGLFRHAPGEAVPEPVRDAWPAIEAECRRIFGEGWRK